MESKVKSQTFESDEGLHYIPGQPGIGIRLRGFWIRASDTVRAASADAYLDLYDMDDSTTPYVRVQVTPGNDSGSNPPYPRTETNVNLQVYNIPGAGVRFPGGLKLGEAGDVDVWGKAVFFYEG
jgi:hypothetical protein